MHICPCSWSIEISKKIWSQEYFGTVTVDSVEIFRHFAFWRHRTRLASFFIESKNCVFWGATFELIKNLATLVPEKLQGFYETLLYHCYTVTLLDASSWHSMMHHNTHVNTSRRTFWNVKGTVTGVEGLMTHMQTSCHTYANVVSHVCKRRVTHMQTSCHTYQRVTS